MRTLTLALLNFFVLTALSNLSANPVKQQSGTEWLDRTANFYKQLHSFDGSSHITETIRGGATLESDINFMLMRPNLIKIDITNSQLGGGRVVVCNGKNLIIYNKSANRYQIFPASSTFTQLLPILRKQAQIGFSLDPIFFFIGEPLPHSLRIDPHVKNIVHNGVKSTIVYATSIPDTAAKRMKQIAMHWEWIINSKSGMIQEIHAQSNSFKVSVPSLIKSKKSVGLQHTSTALTIQLDYLASNANPNLSSNSFVANMKPGAKRVGARK